MTRRCHTSQTWNGGARQSSFRSVADVRPLGRIGWLRYQLDLDVEPWELLTRRARSRMTYRVKRWLNTRAADQMTVELLRERDPDGEVISWLTAIRRLAELC